ncbi:hypothetical protein Mal15_12480 [Stieleria maiorica]|uniref:Uncharacterized protein n=1 Tax=Stieleria maiorica TaxID=2795974 RepID=A0A5B9MAW5_9BACT|nr:hypothetical protein [Stieleria maiorica]QEF97210.1 hypothetical protein Mal15_12480 [Stieleria maiorica]
MRHRPFFCGAGARVAVRPLHCGLISLCVLIGISGGKLNAQLPVIALRSLSQSFYAPGETYEVTVTEGANTDEVVELVFSHPGITATLVKGPPRPLTTTGVPQHGKFSVAVASDVPAGRYEARAVGRFGISNPRSVVVQNGVQVVSAVGSDASTATPIESGQTYCRHASPQRRDYFSFSANAGTQYTLRLIAQAVDSQLIGALSIADAKGRTLASGIGSDYSDLRLTWTATESGVVTVAVHDALFRGGAAFQYGLNVVEGSATPSYLEPEFPKSISVQMQDVQTQDVQTHDIQTEDPVAADESDAAVELEIPALVEATFDGPDDSDHYHCKLVKGQPVQIEVVSDRIGQPTDARLIIDRGSVDAAGAVTWQRVATAEDGPNLSDSIIRLASGDPVLRFQPPEDGDYRITVTDLDTGRSLGDVQRYQLAIGPPRQDWHLLAYHVYPHKDAKTSQPSGSHLMRGGATTIRVFVYRNQMSGPIKVSIPDLPVGLSCRPSWIAANQNHADLVITASDQTPTQHAPLQVIGEANRDGQTESRIASAASVIWQQDGYRPTAHVRLIDGLQIGSSEIDTSPISIATATPDVVTAMKGTKVTVPIKVTRRDGGADNIVLRAQHLPPGVSVAELTIAKDKSEAEWTIDVKNNAAAGTYTFWGQGETKVKFAVNPQSLTRETEYRDALKTLRADPSRSDQHAEIDKAIAEADKRIETLKTQTAARDFTIYVPLPAITLEVQ